MSVLVGHTRTGSPVTEGLDGKDLRREGRHTRSGRPSGTVGWSQGCARECLGGGRPTVVLRGVGLERDRGGFGSSIGDSGH